MKPFRSGRRAAGGIAVVLGVLAVAGAGPASGASFIVAPNGDDTGDGTEAKPFPSLARARDAIRERKRAGPLEEPVTVYLRAGTHLLTEPVVFTHEDSGAKACPITYAAYEGERAVLSGGRRITGWRKGKGNVWMVELPDVKKGAWRFRQLYVNGQARRRSRIPNQGFLRVAGFPDGGREVHYHTDCQRFEYKPGDIKPTWTNLTDVEVIVYHYWTDSHLPIRSIDTKTNIVTFAHKAGKVFTDDFLSVGARYVVENVYEGLDAPGEWYLSRTTGVLSYIPMPGEDMNAVEVIAPVSPACIVLKGDAAKGRPVEHLAFRNLSFMHTNFELPKGNSNDRQGSSSVPAAIVLTGARHCAFEHCRISNTGTFAFELTNGCTDNRFRFNEITHVAAGAFRIGGGSYKHPPLDRTGRNTITDNEIGYYGDEYPSAVGILLTHTFGNTVAHNHIHHGWYTGISAGWVWGYGPSVSRDNRIEHNHIHDIGQGLLSDMGGIYTLGVSPGTVIRGNLIHDVDANHYGGWGIYNDEGSSHILIEDNIVYRTKFAGYNIHYAKEITVRNNIFAFGRIEQLTRGRNEPHRSVTFENNIVYWTQGALLAKNWKDVPYEFHYQPIKQKGHTGTRTTTSTFDMDWNVYFNPTLKLEQVKFAGGTWDEWRKRGKDGHSLYVDPQFVDAAKFDFRLQPTSPALKLGFRPIDMSQVGPRAKAGPQW